MSEFFNVVPPSQGLKILLESLPKEAPRPFETVPVEESLRRVTAERILSPELLPHFARSTMDGFSVKAKDTFGATEGLPSYLEIVGEVPMGKSPSISLKTGEAAITYTGGMLASEADAVVMVENTQRSDEHTIEVMKPVAVGENVISPGEDLNIGDTIISKGKHIRAQDIGAIRASGIETVTVVKKPIVGLLSMGDEIVPTNSTPQSGQIRDINTHTIAAMVETTGCIPKSFGIAKDNFEEQLHLAQQGIHGCDVLIFSAGSSVSTRDMTADVINALGEPVVLVPGQSLKPGKPAILGVVNDKPIFGLPGNPVSAMIVFDLIVSPTLYHLSGCIKPPMNTTTTATLSLNIASAAGREDYIPVRLESQGDETFAHPVFGKSNLIHTLSSADGLIQVPLDKSGLYQGETVKVKLF